jgi:hypothetical protein
VYLIELNDGDLLRSGGDWNRTWKTFRCFSNFYLFYVSNDCIFSQLPQTYGGSIMIISLSTGFHITTLARAEKNLYVTDRKSNALKDSDNLFRGQMSNPLFMGKV